MDTIDIIFGWPPIIAAPVMSFVVMGCIIFFMIRKDTSMSWKEKSCHVMVISSAMFLISFFMTQKAVFINESKNETEVTSRHQEANARKLRDKGYEFWTEIPSSPVPMRLVDGCKGEVLFVDNKFEPVDDTNSKDIAAAFCLNG